MPETKVISLPAAAYALAKGAKFLRCEPSQPGRVDFVFEDPQGDVATIAKGFYQGASLPARDYYRALQDIRFAVNHALSGGE